MSDIEEIVGSAAPVSGFLIFWKARPESQNGQWMFASRAAVSATNPYEGFQKIRNGDHLVVLDSNDPSKKFWEGTVFLKTHRQVGYPAKTAQKGVDAQEWMKWFSQGLPAILTPGIDRMKFKTEKAFNRVRKAAQGLPASYQRQLVEALQKKLPGAVKPGEGQVFEGALEDFFEQGSEAHNWFLYRDEDPAYPVSNDYYRLVGLEEGDFLEIFDESGNVIWSGAIAYNAPSDAVQKVKRKHGGYMDVWWLQAGIEPDQWIDFFSKGYRARLTKPRTQ